jgi:hypothetical protein
MDKNLKSWDNKLEDDTLEDGVLVLEKFVNSLMDDDDHLEMPHPSITMFPMSKTPTTTLGDSSSVLPTFSSTQFHPTLAPLPHGGPHNSCVGGKRK